MVLVHIPLRLGQHATGAAGGVEEFAHGARPGQEVVVVDKEQVDHEADDVAGREVIAGGLVGEFVETADAILE